MSSSSRQFHAHIPIKGLHFSRPLVLFHSDDWGLVGIRDGEGFEKLRSSGLDLGSHPHDFYSLETAEDLRCLYEVLARHRDSVGRSPSFVFNFIVANVNFANALSAGFSRGTLLPLDAGLPDGWRRLGLLEAYREGIARDFVYPAFHGLTHFCGQVAERTLHTQDERGMLLHTLYVAGTPLIYYRTPWISFEYKDDSGSADAGWLNLSTQRSLIQEGVSHFERIFGIPPVSACAPGYRANDDTRQAWADVGIRVAQNGPGLNLSPHWDKSGLLLLYRNVSFEPALDPLRYDEYSAFRQAQKACLAGKPIIVCLHSINFHSTLKNYRALTLARLDHFLTLLEEKFPDLLYAHDGDILDIVQDGSFQAHGQRVSVGVLPRWQWSPAMAGRLVKG